MSRTSFIVLLVLALLWLVEGSVGSALPPKEVLILAGPKQGSYDDHAHRYLDFLRKPGFGPRIENVDNSLEIVTRLDDEKARNQVGFTAQQVDAKAHPDLRSLGAVELQPLFVFVRTSLGALDTPAAFAGKRLVMPPAASATAQAALDVLKAYGVQTEAQQITHLLLKEAAAALQRGEHDVGFFMLAPSSEVIRDLVKDPGLRLFSFSENVALTRKLSYLKPALLPRGAYDLRAPLPPQDVALVGATVNVVVREKMHPALVYTLLDTLKEVHGGVSLVSGHGDFPSLVATALPVHPLASEWAKTGTPWLFAHLNPTLAGLVDAYWGPALFLLALVSAFGTLRSLSEFIQDAALNAALFFLRALQRRVDAGRKPGPLSRLLFRAAEAVVVREDNADRARAQLEKLRPHLGLG